MNGKKELGILKVLSKHKLIGVDSNILIYYFEDNPEFGKASKEIIDLLSTNDCRAVTSILTVSEILSKEGLSAEVAKELENDLFEIPNLAFVDVSRKIALEAARIRREYKFRLPDAIALATVTHAKAKIFITNDSRLKQFKQLKVISLSQLTPKS